MQRLLDNDGDKIIKGNSQVELTGVFASLWMREIFVTLFTLGIAVSWLRINVFRLNDETTTHFGVDEVLEFKDDSLGLTKISK